MSIWFTTARVCLVNIFIRMEGGSSVESSVFDLKRYGSVNEDPSESSFPLSPSPGSKSLLNMIDSSLNEPKGKSKKVKKKIKKTKSQQLDESSSSIKSRQPSPCVDVKTSPKVLKQKSKSLPGSANSKASFKAKLRRSKTTIDSDMVVAEIEVTTVADVKVDSNPPADEPIDAADEAREGFPPQEPAPEPEPIDFVDTIKQLNEVTDQSLANDLVGLLSDYGDNNDVSKEPFKVWQGLLSACYAARTASSLRMASRFISNYESSFRNVVIDWSRSVPNEFLDEMFWKIIEHSKSTDQAEIDHIPQHAQLLREIYKAMDPKISLPYLVCWINFTQQYSRYNAAILLEVCQLLSCIKSDVVSDDKANLATIKSDEAKQWLVDLINFCEKNKLNRDINDPPIISQITSAVALTYEYLLPHVETTYAPSVAAKIRDLLMSCIETVGENPKSNDEKTFILKQYLRNGEKYEYSDNCCFHEAIAMETFQYLNRSCPKSLVNSLVKCLLPELMEVLNNEEECISKIECLCPEHKLNCEVKHFIIAHANPLDPNSVAVYLPYLRDVVERYLRHPEIPMLEMLFQMYSVDRDAIEQNFDSIFNKLLNLTNFEVRKENAIALNYLNTLARKSFSLFKDNQVDDLENALAEGDEEYQSEVYNILKILVAKNPSLMSARGESYFDIIKDSVYAMELLSDIAKIDAVQCKRVVNIMLANEAQESDPEFTNEMLFHWIKLGEKYPSVLRKHKSKLEEWKSNSKTNANATKVLQTIKQTSRSCIVS